MSKVGFLSGRLSSPEVLVQQKYCCNWGLTEELSSAVHIQALYPADGILPVISF